MVMTDAKRKLLDLKRQSCMNKTIDKINLMLLINIAWNKLFARIDKNRRAIADRGWDHIVVIFLPFHTSELQ